MGVTLREMSEDEVAGDEYRGRIRQCGECGEGFMYCTNLTELRVNGGYAGRSYSYQCEECGHVVADLDGASVLYQLVMLPIGLVFSSVLVYFGAQMALDVIRRGPGGNDPTALGVIIVLFLGMGGALLLGVLYTLWAAYGDFRERRASPFLKK